jgi:U6 snRNA-associated Sm-like protein LSm7
MSERGSFRGGGRNRGGGYDRSGGRGGRGGGAGGGAQQQQQEKPKKENILDLSKYMDKEVRVKFSGGREGDTLPCSEASTYANILQFPAL